MPGIHIEAEEASCTLTSPSLPSGWSYDRWFNANYEAGYMIYGVKPPLRERFFQVSNMGELTDEHIEGWLCVVDRLLA
jgi:aspartate aminotransferase-like enzyme